MERFLVWSFVSSCSSVFSPNDDKSVCRRIQTLESAGLSNFHFSSSKKDYMLLLEQFCPIAERDTGSQIIGKTKKLWAKLL
jgi:hypothetical protein